MTVKKDHAQPCGFEGLRKTFVFHELLIVGYLGLFWAVFGHDKCQKNQFITSKTQAV